jgi:hypothetical protein
LTSRKSSSRLNAERSGAFSWDDGFPKLNAFSGVQLSGGTAKFSIGLKAYLETINERALAPGVKFPSSFGLFWSLLMVGFGTSSQGLEIGWYS